MPIILNFTDGENVAGVDQLTHKDNQLGCTRCSVPIGQSLSVVPYCEILGLLRHFLHQARPHLYSLLRDFLHQARPASL